MLDTSIKLYQLSIPELSGYISQFLFTETGIPTSGTFNIVGSGRTYVFANGNDIIVGSDASGLTTSGDLAQALVLTNLENTFLYYPLASGNTLYNQINLLNTWTGDFGSSISGISITGVSGIQVSVSGNSFTIGAIQTGNYVPYSQFGASSTGFNFLYLKDNIKLISSKFNQGKDFYFVGQASPSVSEPYVIDLYGSQAPAYSLTSGQPFILGFDVYAGVLTSSGNRVLTTADDAVTESKLIYTSGTLNNKITKNTISGTYSLSGSGAVIISVTGDTIVIGANISGGGSSYIPNIVYTTGDQRISGIKTFNSSIPSKLDSLASIDPNNRYLMQSGDGENVVVDWQNQRLNGNDSSISIDWQNRTLNDSLNAIRLNWQNNLAYNYAGQTTLDWQHEQLIDHNLGISSLNWASRILIDSNNINSLNWNVRGLFDSAGQTTYDWDNNILYTNGQQAGNFSSRVLTDYDDTYGTSASVDWTNRILQTKLGVTTLNWASQILVGTWQADGLIISGSSVLLASQTGNFYPRSNPSGYITGLNINTGSFVTTGQTGSFITTSQTGQFYSSANPSGFITGVNTGNFITTGQTGAFASLANLLLTGGSLQNAVNSINIWTGNSTGLYYPRFSNPSGYITGLNTGNFITTSQTGQFYPNFTNPSGYIIPSQTGAFASLANLVATGGSLTTLINNLSGTLTGNYVLKSATGIFITTGMSGQFYPRFTNPSSYSSLPDITDNVGSHYIGINQASPTATLDVNGNAQFLNGVTSIGGDNSDNNGLVFFKNGGGLVGGLFTENAGVTLSMAVNEGQVGTRDEAYPGAIFRLDARGNGVFIIYGSPAGGSAFNNRFSVDLTNGDTILVSDGGSVGVGIGPSYKLDVGGDFQSQSSAGVTFTNSDSLRLWTDGGNGGVIGIHAGNNTLSVDADNEFIEAGNSDSARFIVSFVDHTPYLDINCNNTAIGIGGTATTDGSAPISFCQLGTQWARFNSAGGFELYSSINNDYYGFSSIDSGLFMNGNFKISGNLTVTGNIFVSGNISQGLQKVSGLFSIKTGHAINLVDVTVSGATGTFPNASGVIGMQYVVKDWKGNAASKNIILTGVNSQTFDGSLSKSIVTNYGSFTLVSDGKNWSII